MGYASEHPYLLNTAHSPPPCSFFGKNSLLPFTPIFRFEMLLCLMNSTLVSPNTRIEEPIVLSLDFSAESRTPHTTFTHHRSQQLPLTLSRVFASSIGFPLNSFRSRDYIDLQPLYPYYYVYLSTRNQPKSF